MVKGNGQIFSFSKLTRALQKVVGGRAGARKGPPLPERPTFTEMMPVSGKPGLPQHGEQEWLPQISQEVRGTEEWRKAMQATIRHIMEAVTVTTSPPPHHCRASPSLASVSPCPIPGSEVVDC